MVKRKKSFAKEPVVESSREAKQIALIKSFHIEFRNTEQNLAYQAYQKNDLLFLLGCAGGGKTFAATAFAVQDILNKNKDKIIISRPVVESGEKLGFLPGDLGEKTYPFMVPIFDCIDRICGRKSRDREIIGASLEVVPLAYTRGRTFNDCVFILDECQNCSFSQLKMALTRMGENCKMIVTGDPDQSDLAGKPAILDLMEKLQGMKGMSTIYFKENSVVRHPLVSKILQRLS